QGILGTADCFGFHHRVKIGIVGVCQSAFRPMDGQRALIPLKTGRHRRPISPWVSAERIRVALTEPQKGPGTKGGLPLEDVAERPEKGPAAPGCPGEAAP